MKLSRNLPKENDRKEELVKEIRNGDRVEIQKCGKELRLDFSDDFDPAKIFGCGQCFRWSGEDGVYTGVARGAAAMVRKSGGSVYFTCSEEDFRNIWFDYFDLGRDYRSFRRRLGTDGYMKAASEYGAGIRILRQEGWECLCSFLLSQCNNISRIRHIIETLCVRFGETLSFEGKTLYAFPSAAVIAGLTEAELAPLRCGYRAPYLLEAADAVASGRLDLNALTGTDRASALAALKMLSGVGDKVAGCVALFSLQIPDAFPVDVWVARAVREHYGNNFLPETFGSCAGLAQQYMFYYQREENRRSGT